jgi:DNA repair protein RecN (Recombination protein N)
MIDAMTTLDELTARNLGLIRSSSVRLAPGLTVITGETGTGKTLMLGALRLLRGDKAGKGVIGPDGDSCEVSARFVTEGTERVIRRIVDRSRSRAYVDDAAATVAGLADAMAGQVAIIGQHDQLTIASAAGVRTLVDRRLTDAGVEARRAYDVAWQAHQRLLIERSNIGNDLRGLERERDIAAHEIDEIDAVGISQDEIDDLTTRVGRLRNADSLAVDLGAALDALGDDGAGGALDRAIGSLRRAASMDPGLDETVDVVADLATILSERVADLARSLDELDTDPGTLAATEQRIAEFGGLRRKYGDTASDILAYRDDAARRLLALEATLDSADTLEERIAGASATLASAGARLAAERRTAAEVIADVARTELGDLGFRNPVVEIRVVDTEPAAGGADRATVLFASDASLPPGPVSGVASGGELSRLVLALSLGAGSAETPVLAFDEIDTGIGGTTALAMGEKLASLAADRQVICVTHLPQVAAFADVHIAVTRDGTSAEVRILDGDERLAELTRMLAGLSGSDAGRDHAEELLARATGG